MNKLIAGAGIVALASTAMGQVIFSQASNDVEAFAAGSQAGAFFDFRQADDFNLGALPANITGASFFGIEEAFFSADFPGNVSGWEVTIWEDAAGTPGTVAFQQDFAVGDATISATGVPFGATAGVFEVSVDFAFSTAANTTYWFGANAILADGQEDNYFWLGSSAGQTAGWATENPIGSGFLATAPSLDSNGLAFNLRGEIVPTPGAASILGLAGLAAMRRRR